MEPRAAGKVRGRRTAPGRGELATYRNKRDFKATSEPRGRIASRRSKALGFVVQKHAATRLHYDFRLEIGGVMKSWAVPRGPSLDPADKRLAVQTEDHPVEYNSFEGVIPEGQYGAGSVIVWDRGTWIPQGDPLEGYERGRLSFRLEGEKLQGEWTLVRMAGRKAGGGKGTDRNDWLLIKGTDAISRRGKRANIVEQRPESVMTGRTLEEVAPSKRPSPAKLDGVVKRALSDGAKRAMPDRLAPQLATLVASAPASGGWLFEAKLDGYRMLCRLRGGEARFFTRNGHDWTSRLARQAAAVESLPIESAWLDGEIVVTDEKGLTSFQALQRAFSGGGRDSIEFHVFDLPYLDGHDLSGVPLAERKAALAALLTGAGALLRLSDHVQGNGPRFHAQACRAGLEGVIGKRADAPYAPGRTPAWIKVKCRQEQEFVIGGYTEPAGARTGFGALLLGVHDGAGQLCFAGRVGTGFNEKLLQDLQRRLRPLQRATPPFVDAPRGAAARGVHWVEPRLVAEVSFAEWTGEGIVRQASFQGLREDKPARAVIREVAAPKPESVPAGAPPPGRRRKAATAEGEVRAAGVRITHPDRVLYPEAGITKGDLAAYYATVAEWLLPHLRDRPLTLVRCPEGLAKACFFQKHLAPGAHEAIGRVEIDEGGGGRGTYATADTGEAVAALVQMGVIELHTWGSRTDHLDKPDRLVFDLDPGPGLAWGRVTEAATLVRALLDELGLRSFLKTSGGKGLHLVVPLDRRHSWAEVKAFSRSVARHLEQTLPARFTANASKVRRDERIFVDYLRNARGATAVAAFSARARPGAPVSAPLDWDELPDVLRPDRFNVRTMSERLKNLRRDPWADYFDARQSLTLAVRRRLEKAASEA